MDKRKFSGLIAAGIGLVMLLLAAFSSSWLIGKSYGFTSKVGLISVERCQADGHCERESLSEWADSGVAPEGLAVYNTLAKISLVLALVTTTALLSLLIFAIRKRKPQWPIHPGSAVLLLSIALLIIGVLTLALHPLKSAGWGTGPGFLLLSGGDVAALLAALMLGRSEDPSIDEWFE